LKSTLYFFEFFFIGLLIMADKCHPFIALTVSHFWGALQTVT